MQQDVTTPEPTGFIIIHTAYTFEQMRAFARYHFRRARRLLLAGGIPLLAMLILAFAVRWEDVRQFPPTAFVIPVLLVVVVVMGLLATSGLLVSRRSFDEQRGLVDGGQTYTFMADRFEVVSASSDMQGSTTYQYSVIHKLREEKDMFLLYTSKNNAMLLDKAGFREGTPEDFRRLMMTKLSRKQLYLRG